MNKTSKSVTAQIYGKLDIYGEDLTSPQSNFLIYAIGILQSRYPSFHEIPLLVINLNDVEGYFYSVQFLHQFLEQQLHDISSQKISALNCDTGKAQKLSLFSEFMYSLDTREMQIRFSDELFPYITNNSSTMMHAMSRAPFFIVPTFSEFPNNHSFSRLYVLLAKYRGSIYFDLDDLRSILNLGDTYKKYSHIKNRILTPAQISFINTKDIEISFTYREIPERPINKQGKKVTGIEFEVFYKKGSGFF